MINYFEYHDAIEKLSNLFLSLEQRSSSVDFLVYNSPYFSSSPVFKHVCHGVSPEDPSYLWGAIIVSDSTIPLHQFRAQTRDRDTGEIIRESVTTVIINLMVPESTVNPFRFIDVN